MSIDIRVPFWYLQLITLFSNLHFVKDFLKMDQGWASIHGRKDLFPLKPPLVHILKSCICDNQLLKPSCPAGLTTTFYVVNGHNWVTFISDQSLVHNSLYKSHCNLQLRDCLLLIAQHELKDIKVSTSAW